MDIRIANLREEIAALSFSDFGGEEIATDLGCRWAKPPVFPKEGVHPRLLITKDDLPRLRETLTGDGEDFKNVLADHKARVECETDGKLPAGDLSPTHQFPGIYNWDGDLLDTIQSKALHYAVFGDEAIGLEAIRDILNFIKTLDIGYFQDDQWRRYGYAMFTAALVYDWCYPLTDERSRRLLIAGVQHLLCEGKSSIPERAHWNGVKMEILFPPMREGGYVVGHSSELSFLCFYVSFALAIFDEVPGWWDMIGGRLYEEYVPIRKQLYATGMFPNGTAEYAQMRYIADLYSAWLLRTAIGDHPYRDADMARVVHSFICHEAGGKGFFFVTGDGTQARRAEIGFCAAMSAYLSGDSLLRSYVSEKMQSITAQTAKTWHTWMSSSNLLICFSRKMPISLDFRDKMETILYNGGYYQQIIARDGWRGEDSTVVLMHGAGRTSGGHDHASIGNFEIYRGGILTGDGGVYDGWGNPHHLHYHQGTIAHNSILIDNPARKDTCDGYYSGGQIEYYDSHGLHVDATFLTTDTSTLRGECLGMSAAWYDGERREGKAVYYDNEFAKAYEPDTAEYVRRSEYLFFPKEKEIHAALILCDRVDAVSGDFKKTFLLQTSGKPTVSAEEIWFENGSARLSLFTGDSDTKAKVFEGENHYRLPDSEKQLPPSRAAENDTMCARIEIAKPIGNKTDSFLHVILVTDAGKAPSVSPKFMATNGFRGSSVLGETVWFPTERGYFDGEISLPLTGDIGETVHIGGLACGEWTVMLDGKKTAVSVSEAEHLLSFAAGGCNTARISRKR